MKRLKRFLRIIKLFLLFKVVQPIGLYFKLYSTTISYVTHPIGSSWIRINECDKVISDYTSRALRNMFQLYQYHKLEAVVSMYKPSIIDKDTMVFEFSKGMSTDYIKFWIMTYRGEAYLTCFCSDMMKHTFGTIPYKFYAQVLEITPPLSNARSYERMQHPEMAE